MNPPKGHPKGLYLLFVTEMWERFSYYGMRALFMLYMVQALLFDKELASQVYGSYTGLVYLTPLIGGYIADRYWGNRRSIVTGALTMAVGQFLLFLSACYYHEVGLAKYLMFCGLGLLILGNGFFKPNISTMVGRLYRPDDSRKDSAFTIFYMGVNVGSTLAPLICGLIGNTGHPEDFKWGFLAACIGMLLGAAVFRIFMNRYICDPDGNPVGTAPARSKETTEKDEKKPSNTGRTVLMVAFTLILTILFSVNWGHTSDGVFAGADWIGSLIYATVIVMPIIIITDKSLTRTEQARIGVIYIIAFFVIFFWSAYEQAGASLTFFADEQTDRRIGNWEMPAAYFQSFNPIMIVTLAPVFAAIWSFLGKRGWEPSSPRKQSIGLLLLSLGYLYIAFGVKDIEPGVKVSMAWLTGLYLIHTMGELCLAPIGLSLVYKLSPARFSSLLMGVWYLSTSAANKFAGFLSGFYPEHGVSKSCLGYQVENLYDFFMLFVFMSGAAAVILFLLSGKLQKMMKGIE
ncbi:peptide MFS transporter [Phocaeicola barnesiae]|uniref:Peptide MFS transporter n=1 Tax=Phocaeicola barnesiae TaxID=376804 RepID=A0AAW5N2A1_9BACT|nr:peptide MFS transporter [Phocaeicola barnesiae]MCR8872803.1 peptide MFS transporter [Phocaeicola barnesiae]HJG76847.1 peptide MFS transporter [Phocaeicola barnesiae]